MRKQKRWAICALAAAVLLTAGCSGQAADGAAGTTAESAGQEAAEELGVNYTPVQQQSDALMEVASGTCDAAIIDSLMAAAMVGEGTGYANLTYTLELTSEEYGVGFRKGSDLAEELNKFFEQSYADGTMQQIAEKYGVQAALIEQ